MDHKISVLICRDDYTTLFMRAHPEYRITSEQMYQVDTNNKMPDRLVGYDVCLNDLYGVHPDDMDREEHWFTVVVDDEWLEYLRANIDDYMHAIGTDPEMFVYLEEEFERVWDIELRPMRKIKNKRYAAQRELVMHLTRQAEREYELLISSGASYEDIAENMVNYMQTIRSIVQ